MDSNQIKYNVVGLMSGTSLDGLDIAHCTFKKTASGWEYSINKADTVKYSKKWSDRLAMAHTLSAEDLLKLDAEYGKLLGDESLKFITNHKLKADFIASHGHTIFHQPDKGFTYQLGNGNALYAATQIPVVYDFRSLDVARGGEGAPLVPAGDKFLFGDYDVCLNLGGIANLSMDIKQKRLAFDICFVNMGLNYLAQKKSKTYDKGGELSSNGTINQKMLSALNKIYSKYRLTKPSLGREIFEKQIKPLLDKEDISIEDRLRTFTESSAQEIVAAFPKEKINVLCTGGGAFNSFLISCMLDKCDDDVSIIIPDDNIVKFKEALVFAFLGVLRVRNEVNCLKSVTGAQCDSSGGVAIGF
ncbi:MAG TPA: anhydro-N-acetylmuramic acid kinase [Cyclobacteriaceae bacterium]